LPIYVNYTKKRDDSVLKVTFSSNMRTYNIAGSCCRWTIRVNGENCTPPVDGLVYINITGANPHRHRTIVGICRDIPAGPITVRPYVELCQGYGPADCFTGWNSTSTILVEELY
jgi:hypothetical protein